MYGNTGKVLDVDLSSGKVEELELDEDIYKQYVGGVGLAAKLIYDRGNLGAEPLDEDALLIFATGPMAGTGMYGTSRLSVGARSPLTGIRMVIKKLMSKELKIKGMFAHTVALTRMTKLLSVK